MTGIVLQELSVTLGGKTILCDLSHTFAKGQWHVILGKSGAGKSTLLRAIANLLPPGAVQGSIRFGADARMALMAQQNDLLPWLTARDNILLGSRLRGEKGDMQNAEHWLAAIGLAGQGDKRPAQFSGGERQRLALARTLAENRPLVLMDEPFSALDAVNRHTLQTLAAQLLKEKTVIMITHDPQEALRLSDTLHILEQHPTRLTPARLPAGQPPRQPDEEGFAAVQRALLERLADA